MTKTIPTPFGTMEITDISQRGDIITLDIKVTLSEEAKKSLTKTIYIDLEEMHDTGEA